MTKNDIRSRVYAKRKLLTKDNYVANNMLILEKLKYLLKIISNEGVNRYYIYASYGKEVATEDIFSYLKEQGALVAYPKVIDERLRKMSFVYVDDLNNLGTGYKGITEPLEDIYCDDDSKEAIIIVPLVAFSKDLSRLGYGGGYYDKYLSEHRFIKKIGLAFEFQRFDNMEVEMHDVKLDYIITEKNIYGGIDNE